MPPIQPTRRHFMAQLAAVPLALRQAAARFRKLDVHAHITGDARYVHDVMDTFNIKVMTVCDGQIPYRTLAGQADIAAGLVRSTPRYYAWATMFSVEQLKKKNAVDLVNASLKADFDNGAIAVMVPYEIGARVFNTKGRLLQIDDPALEPVLDFIRQENKTLIVDVIDPHLVTIMSRPGPAAAEAEAAALRGAGGVSYFEMVRARDSVIATHPGLRVINSRLGGIDVDDAAQRLDRHPNLAVDTRGAIYFLSRQSRAKVRAFFLKYQDRILYAGETVGGAIPPQEMGNWNTHAQWPSDKIESHRVYLAEQYERDIAYYTTSRLRFRGTMIEGLDLPDDVTHKLFYGNAVRWLPGIERDFA